MNRPAHVLLFLIVFAPVNLALGQVNAQSAPDPVVTAQNESWHLNGEPIAYAGNLYYPTGPQTYFNRYEMVRSGFVQGIPLYTKTTIEPYSMVFVPIGGGLMQPYERRRAGDVAGTVGSTTPSFPGNRSFEPVSAARSGDVPMAPAPPTGLADSAPEVVRPPLPLVPAPSVPLAIGTSGTVRPSSGGEPVPVISHVTRRRGTLNAAFVEFDGTKWLSRGAAVILDEAFVRVGEYHGLPVYSRGDRDAIYIPVQRDAVLLAKYVRR